MMTDDQLSKLRELDKIIKIANSEEGKHILEELKKADFYNKLSEDETTETGALEFLANMAIDASDKAFRLESDIIQLHQAMKDMLKMHEDHLYNKGDISPSENTMQQEINNIRSRHSFLY